MADGNKACSAEGATPVDELVRLRVRRTLIAAIDSEIKTVARRMIADLDGQYGRGFAALVVRELFAVAVERAMAEAGADE